VAVFAIAILATWTPVSDTSAKVGKIAVPNSLKKSKQSTKQNNRAGAGSFVTPRPPRETLLDQILHMEAVQISHRAPVVDRQRAVAKTIVAETEDTFNLGELSVSKTDVALFMANAGLLVASTAAADQMYKEIATIRLNGVDEYWPLFCNSTEEVYRVSSSQQGACPNASRWVGSNPISLKSIPISSTRVTTKPSFTTESQRELEPAREYDFWGVFDSYFPQAAEQLRREVREKLTQGESKEELVQHVSKEISELFAMNGPRAREADYVSLQRYFSSTRGLALSLQQIDPGACATFVRSGELDPDLLLQRSVRESFDMWRHERMQAIWSGGTEGLRDSAPEEPGHTAEDEDLAIRLLERGLQADGPVFSDEPHVWEDNERACREFVTLYEEIELLSSTAKRPWMESLVH
jgi:hypothetical protein